MTAANAQWQSCGGILDIPEGWSVFDANFDAYEPYIKIINENTDEEKIIPVPKPLAYYLSVHFCGSNNMRKQLKNDGRREVQSAIKRVLGF